MIIYNKGDKMKCYIEFFYNDDNELNAVIHKQGKHKVINKKAKINKLIEIANKNGQVVEGPCIIEDKVITISQEYDKYVKKHKIRLHIIEITNINI